MGKDAVEFFAKYKAYGTKTKLKDGTESILFRKITDSSGNTISAGGYFTPDGRVVTFWYN